jgi:hypothetical protein
MEARTINLRWNEILAGASLSVLILVVFLPAYGSSSFIENVSSPRKHINDSDSNPIPASVDFHSSFSSIDSVCFIFAFKGNNQLDPTEELEITPDIGGFVNPGTVSQSQRTLCFNQQQHPEVISKFLDGRENFGIRMVVGSIAVKSLSIEINGTELDTKA